MQILNALGPFRMLAASLIFGCFIGKLERGEARRSDADALLFYFLLLSP